MKILLINSIFYPAVGWGGPITATYDLARKLAAKGNEVTVFTGNAKDYNSNLEIKNKIKIEGFEIQYFTNWSRGIRYFFTPGIIPALLKNISKYDIVHINSYRQFQDMVSFIVLSIIKKPFVLTSHGYVLPEGVGKRYKKMYDFFIGKKILRKSKKIIAFHEKNLKEYQKMGVDAKNIEIIPNTIDIEKIPEKGNLRKKLGLKNNEKILLYLGRINEDKGIGYLIEAFSKIKQEKLHLVLAGPDFDFMDKAKKMIEDLKLEKRTHFLGLVEKKEKFEAFADADFTVYPSLHEAGISMVVLESAAAAKPIIISDSIGFSEEVKSDNAGIAIPVKDIEQFSNAIEWMYLNETEAMEMGKRAQEIVKKKFSWENAVQQHLKVYREAIQI
jgi:glycosyltransferase involved in cell wall biosynthesis